MDPTPRQFIDPAGFQGLACTICAETALEVVHLDSYPDYVACGACGSQFVMEQGGDRAMYGTLPDEYPETRRFALQQWAWLEAIERKAQAERPEREIASPEDAVEPPGDSGVDLWDEDRTEDSDSVAQVEPEPEDFRPATEAPLSPEEPSPVEEGEMQGEHPEPMPDEDASTSDQAAEDGSDLWAGDPPADEPRELSRDDFLQRTPMNLKTIKEEAESEPEPEALPKEPPLVDTPHVTEDGPGSMQATAAEEEQADIDQQSADPKEEAEVSAREGVEPDPGKRFRVVLRLPQPTIPQSLCAHCSRTPAQQELVVVGPSDEMGQTQTYNLPLCNPCHRRARARSEEEGNARVTAFLGAALGSVLAIVAALALGLVSFQENLMLDVMILAIIGVLGFALPLWFLLARASGYAPPPDAIFVRSTLAIPEGGEDVHTAFEWRNEIYAKRFMEANFQTLIGDVTEVRDWLDLGSAADEEA